MALVIKDRVKETTTTTGTGTLTLAGAASGFQAFSAIGDGNTTYYAITDSATGDWEVGLGTYTASGTTLSRDTILASSNAGSAVNLSAGTKNAFATYPAGKAAFFDDIPTNNNQLTNGAGYITGNQTITLSGDVTGSGTTSISVTVADDSHNHIISNVDGLQDALDAKQASATALTTSTSFSGDVSGTYNSIAVTNDSHTHDTRYYTETEIGNFFNGTTAITGYSKSNWDTAYGWGNHASAGYLTGNQTITLSGDATGSGTTAITVTVANDSHSHSTSTLTGLGALATLSTVDASTITDNSVGAAELNVSGNGTSGQFLSSDGDGSFSWATVSGAIPGEIRAIASNLSGSYSIPSSGTVDANGWMYCNGAAIPSGRTVSGTTPDLTDGRFLRGSTSAGSTGGADSFTLATTNLPSHTHSINHDHASVTSGSAGSHTHTANHSHTGSSSTTGSHNHNSPFTTNSTSTTPYGTNGYADTTFNEMAVSTTEGNELIRLTSSNGDHSHTITVDTANVTTSSASDHTHSVDLPSFSGTSGATGSGSAVTHIPKYVNVQYLIQVG